MGSQWIYFWKQNLNIFYSLFSRDFKNENTTFYGF